MSILKAAARVLLLCIFAGPAAAQQMLPHSFSGWTSNTVERAAPGGLEPFAGEQSPILREYGTLSAERRTYARSGDSLVATVYRLRDPSGAFGAATFLRDDQMRRADFGENSLASANRALVPIGNLLLTVESRTDLAAVTSDLRALVSTLYSKAQLGALPLLDQYMPREGFVSGSRRYILGPAALSALVPLGTGDWIGFSQGAEANVARYRVGGETLTLIIASYPTHQMAARRLRAFSMWLAVNPEGPVPAGQTVIFAKRSSSLLAVVLGTNSKKTADALLEPILYQAELTWNEPSFSATDPPFVVMILEVFYGIGALLMFALAAGIGYGGLRVVLKKVMPGRFFDRDQTVGIVQLGLSSKPIEAKDFYHS